MLRMTEGEILGIKEKVLVFISLATSVDLVKTGIDCLQMLNCVNGYEETDTARESGSCQCDATNTEPFVRVCVDENLKGNDWYMASEQHNETISGPSYSGEFHRSLINRRVTEIYRGDVSFFGAARCLESALGEVDRLSKRIEEMHTFMDKREQERAKLEKHYGEVERKLDALRMNVSKLQGL